MVVWIEKHAYRVAQEEYKGLLQIASEQVPFGIYALEKDGKTEFRHDHCKSMSQLKALIRSFRQQGFKVYANRGG